VKDHTAQVVRWSLLRLLTIGAIVETIWTIYVGWKLPRHYAANHWDIAWVGVDAAEVVTLALTALTAWRRRPLVVIFATISATLLLVDAWFDVTTARRGDVAQGLLLAVLVELPSAAVLLWIAMRALRVTASAPDPLSRQRVSDEV